MSINGHSARGRGGKRPNIFLTRERNRGPNLCLCSCRSLRFSSTGRLRFQSGHAPEADIYIFSHPEPTFDPKTSLPVKLYILAPSSVGKYRRLFPRPESNYLGDINEDQPRFFFQRRRHGPFLDPAHDVQNKQSAHTDQSISWTFWTNYVDETFHVS